MLKNNIKIAWRNLLKNKGFSAINIGGLAIGMALVILIGLWVYDEVTYNKNHDNYDRIAQILIHKTANGNTRTRPTIPYPLGDELRNSYGSNFDHVVMSSYHGDNLLTVDKKSLSISGGFMEPDALKMFSLQMIKGDWYGLQNTNSIVISETTAHKFFGTNNAIGEVIKLNNKLNVTVTGVFKDFPFNSAFNTLDFISSWELYTISAPWVKRARDKKLWDNNSYQLYVQIAAGTTMAAVNEKITHVVYDNLPKYSKKSNPELVLHPMKNWHLYADWKNGVNVGGFIQYVWLFGIIGLFVLLLACINFMNLSTAQSEKRAKEVGIRKTIGSRKSQLIGQFLSESFIVVSFAYALAIIIVIIAIPSFNQLADKQIVFPYNSFYFSLLSVGFIIATSLIAGSYPSLYLSSFLPVKVLKGTFKSGTSAAAFRKSLVVIQFIVSVVLVIGVIVIEKQIKHSKNRPIGYNQNGLIMIEKTTEDYEGKYNLLRHELINNGAALEMSASSSPLTGAWSSNGGFQWEGKDPNFITNMFTFCISHDYGKTMDWNITKGRDFSREFSTDSTAFILNEAAVKYMGLENPIGKTIRWNNQKHKVIGVVKDIIADSPFSPTKQSVYMIKHENTNWINLKLNPEKSVSQSLTAIKKVFNKHIPNVPFTYEFVDEAFATKFKAIERIRKLSTIFAFFAIFISCLGLFGLTSFMVEQRTKEIGVRKVLGASFSNLWLLLSKDFVGLVIISCLIAIPVSFYLMTEWLQKYEYRTEISWWIFGFAIIAAILVTLITISFQSLKAAAANPIKSLRTE